jgi:D-alanyl-D-alanine carboxypeptidase (penicillin-binding protein 5/6)
MLRRRLVYSAVLLALVIGMIGSAHAVPSRGGHARKGVRAGSRYGKAIRAPSQASIPLREYLELPRPESPLLPLGVSAASAILMDAETGEVLFARNPDDLRPPASTTKILTALVILEQGRLGDMVTVSRAAAEVGGHQLRLRAGHRISLEDLLAATLIQSANDAAVAAAEHVGGSLPGFVALMNARARDLGLRDSRFTNPHGLDEPGHYTSARDLARLAQVALEHPSFARLVRTSAARLTVWQAGRKGLQRPRARIVRSHNKLLGRLDGVDGVKTGYTGGAGRCLVASASRDGQRLIAVLLNDPHRWSDAAVLLEYGFGSTGGAVQGRTPDAPWRAAQAAGGQS